MDPTEDLSARVLLKHILRTEPPRSPITRSASKTQNTSPSRRSSRLSNKAAVAQTPQDILRRSLRQKIRESITRKSLTSTKRRTASVVHRKTNTATTASMLFDDGDTPRHILKNILMTEPVRSPVVHKKTEAEEPQPSSANASITSKRSSIELSGLDLPDITIGHAASIARGLSRKRPRRSLNVTAFEKRLKDADDIGEESEESVREHSSLSLSSSNLSLKTPFVDVQTEKRGLQRRASNRRKITEEEFGTAVDKRQTGEASSVVGKGPSETAYSEGFTLGLSKLSEPDITTDIVHCNTALYAQPDAIPSSISIVATQDKTTVMSSQLQRQLIDTDQEELKEVEQNKWKKEASAYLFPTEDVAVAQPEIEDLPFEDNVDADKSSEEERKGSDDKSEDAGAMLKSEEEEGTVKSPTFVIDDKSKPEEEERRVESQTEDVPDSQHEEDGVMESNIEECGVVSMSEEDCRDRSQSEKEEAAPDSQMKDTTEGGGRDDSQPEEDATGRSQSEEEEAAPDFQIDNTTARRSGDDSQHEEDAGGGSESEEEEPVTDSQPEEEEDEVDAETKKLAATDSLPVEEENTADNQKEPDSLKEPDFRLGVESDEEIEEEDHLGGDGEHITRRAHCSGGGVMPVTEAEGGLTDATETGWSEKTSRAHSTFNKYGSDPPEQAAEQEEEWEDEEEREGVPSKTPAFVREKRIFSQPDPLASPSVLKNIQTRGTGESGPSPKPKQVRKRAKPAKREGGLPKAYLMGVFKHFAKMKVSADAYPILKEIMDKFFERLAEDLETYALHAKRKTIEIEDAELLLRRQGYVNDKVPVEVLIEKFLRMDQRRLLIPIATSGNVVIPKKR